MLYINSLSHLFLITIIKFNLFSFLKVSIFIISSNSILFLLKTNIVNIYNVKVIDLLEGAFHTPHYKEFVTKLHEILDEINLSVNYLSKEFERLCE